MLFLMGRNIELQILRTNTRKQLLKRQFCQTVLYLKKVEIHLDVVKRVLYHFMLRIWIYIPFQ